MSQTDTIVSWSTLQSKFGMKPGLIAKLVGAVVSSQPAKLVEIRNVLATGELEPLAKLAHGVKGVAANLYAPSLQMLAGKVEELALAGDASSVMLGEQLATLLENMLLELQKHQAETNN
jgi:histidine phosphotransfer protein HptB